MNMPAGITWPDLYPKQARAFYPSTKHSVIEGSTKSGKTGGALIWIISQALRRGKAHAWFSPVKSQARDAFYRCCAALPSSRVDDHETYRRVLIPDRPAAIYFLSADSPDSIYGKGFYSVVVDEASRAKQSSWGSIRTLGTSTSAPYRVLGNVRDRSNWHYKLARAAEKNERPNWSYHELHYSDAVAAGMTPVEQSDIDQLRRDLPEHLVPPLLDNEPMAAATNPFGGLQKLQEMATSDVSLADPVAHGVDLARVQDWTVNFGLDGDGQPAIFDRFQQPWGATIERVTRSLNGPTCVDQTGVGDAVLPRIKRDAAAGPIEGVKSTGPRKRDLYESLAAALDNGEIVPLEGQMITELAGIETHVTASGYTYDSGEDHDDCVDALALALRAWRRRRIVQSTAENTSGRTIDAASVEDHGW